MRRLPKQQQPPSLVERRPPQEGETLLVQPWLEMEVVGSIMLTTIMKLKIVVVDDSGKDPDHGVGTCPVRH